MFQRSLTANCLLWGLIVSIPDVCFFFTVINGRLGPTNAGILGTPEGKCFKTCRSVVVAPKSKCSSMSPARGLTKENNSKLNGVVLSSYSHIHSQKNDIVIII